MNDKKITILEKCVSIVLLILGVILENKNIISYKCVILILLIIINMLVRFKIFQDKNVYFISSLILEMILIYICYEKFGGILFFYFFPVFFDISCFTSKPTEIILDIIALIMFIFTGRSLPYGELMSSMVCFLSIIILFYYIKEESEKKLYAEDLYDKLRISEEKLKDANNELERYANCIEEITMLKERNRISREIHDSVGHTLSTIMIQLSAIEKLAKDEGSKIAPIAENLRNFVSNTLQEVRKAVRELKPSEYEKYEGILALEELLKNYKKLTGTEVRLSFTKEKWELTSEQSLAIYRVTQEFLSNASRHGKAKVINIFMNFSKNYLNITLKDDGVGCLNIKEGIGLKSIKERIAELGGNIEYNSEVGQGFILKCSIKRDYLKECAYK